MQRHRGPGFGKVALIDSGGISLGHSCEQVVLRRALDDLAEAASRDTRIADARDRLESATAGQPWVATLRHLRSHQPKNVSRKGF